MPVKMRLSKMGIAAGNVSLKASLFLWALCSVAVERVANKFGFIRIEKGEICWNKTLKRFQKTGTIAQLRSLERTEL